VNLPEIVVVMLIATALITATVAYSVPFLVKESMYVAVNDIRSALRTARTESIARNRPTRFVIDTGARSVQVWDGNATGITSDDVLLLERPLPSAVLFERPDTGFAVTLQALGGTLYQSVFTSGGAVSAGVGSVHVRGGERFARISVYGSGGVQAERWVGTSWQEGAL
jgi:Tfp pilus assembly protein FimT